MQRQLPVLTPSPLPPLYAGWIDQLLAGPIPPEIDATCDDCAMLFGEPGERKAAGVFFNPETKCCSYIPSLANYLVGRIIGDTDPGQGAGQATVQERLRAGVAVTPLGLGQPPSFKVLYGVSSDTLFGQSRTFRCPHYLDRDGGRCGVWKHRASVCATWHCKYVRGLVGHAFWTALQQLLSAVERSLSRWCVLELDVGSEALRELFALESGLKPAGRVEAWDLDGLPDPAESRKLWGHWAGREMEFYQECAHLVDALDWQQVVALNRAEIQVYSRLLCEAYARLVSQGMPGRLKIGAFQVLGIDQDSCCISTYNQYDPLNVPRQLIDVLGYFDGRPTDEALELISETEQVTVDPGLIRKLADFGVLVPVQID